MTLRTLKKYVYIPKSNDDPLIKIKLAFGSGVLMQCLGCWGTQELCIIKMCYNKKGTNPFKTKAPTKIQLNKLLSWKARIYSFNDGTQIIYRLDGGGVVCTYFISADNLDKFLAKIK